jgi:hypothetical protein
MKSAENIPVSDAILECEDDLMDRIFDDGLSKVRAHEIRAILVKHFSAPSSRELHAAVAEALESAAVICDESARANPPNAGLAATVAARIIRASAALKSPPTFEPLAIYKKYMQQAQDAHVGKLEAEAERRVRIIAQAETAMHTVHVEAYRSGRRLGLLDARRFLEQKHTRLGTTYEQKVALCSVLADINDEIESAGCGANL